MVNHCKENLEDWPNQVVVDCLEAGQLCLKTGRLGMLVAEFASLACSTGFYVLLDVTPHASAQSIFLSN